MEERVEEQIEQFYEYFLNRPRAFVLFLTVGCALSVGEIVTNSLILLIKVRKSSEKNGFDILIVNLAIMFIINGVLLIELMLEEAFHEHTSTALCNASQFLLTFSTTSVVFSLVTLVVVARFFSKIAVDTALIVVAIIWVASILDAIPYTPTRALLVALDNGKVRKVCSVPEFADEFEVWREKRLAMIVVEFAIPSVLFAVASIVAILVKSTNASSENRNMLLHAVIIGACFILAKIPMIVLEMLYYNFVDLSYGYYLTFNLITHVVGIANIALYCHFNKTFNKQFHRFFGSHGGDDGRELISKRSSSSE